MSLVSACHSEMTAHLSIINFYFYLFCRDFFARVVPGRRLGPPPGGTTLRKKEDYLQETPSFPFPLLFLRDKVLKGLRAKKLTQA